METTGIDSGYMRCGGIEFLFDEELDAVSTWLSEGLSVEELTESQLRKIEPEVEPEYGARIFRLEEFAQVRNPWHVQALIRGCRAKGVRLRPQTPAAGWIKSAGGVTGVRTEAGEEITAAVFLIASGAWGESLLAPLGVRLGVHPVRGQIVLYRAYQPLVSHILMIGKQYLVPREDGRVLVGSTEEPEAGFEKANTEAGVNELKSLARSLVPRLRHAEVEKTWSGLRPGSPDGMPFIGQVPGYSNVFAAVGHFRAGVQLSLGTAELVRALITGTDPPVPIDVFRLDRVPDATARPAFRS